MPTTHAFHLLLPLQETALRRRALKLTANPHRAEDLVQATLLKAWANRDRFLPGSNLRAWLFTILRNTFFSELRKYRWEVEDVDDAAARAQSEPARQEDALALQELLSALETLPQAQRQPILMTGAFGYSQSEASDACGCTIGTIKSRVSRGRTVLDRILGHDAVLEAALTAGEASAGPVPSRAANRRTGVARAADLAAVRSPARAAASQPATEARHATG
jgi:RNA polymerase sigma-70 factor, ECF subfamily